MVLVEGFGLHTGAATRVVLARRTEPGVTLAAAGVTARVHELSVVSTDRATTVEAEGGRLRVGMVEHAFAALAGMSLYDGIGIEVDGAEMPLLDGGAAAWCEAFAALGAPPSGPRFRVTRSAVLHVGRSRYEFEPGERVEIEVQVEFDDPRIAGEASWSGAGDDFRARIAPARTFALERDIDDFVRRGLARHVAPESVVVIARETILAAGRPFAPDEPARHKLLDLLGDWFLHRGPAKGRLRASRPGHAANRAAFAQARAEGIVAAA